jgi:hypothetical protein
MLRKAAQTEKVMPSLIVGAVFIPGTWLSYLLVRWVLTHFDMNLGDKVALSFLTSLAYLVGHITVAMDLAGSHRTTKVDRSSN